MDNQPVLLTESQLRFFKEKGFLYLPGILNPDETVELQNWTQDVHDLPRTPDSKWMPYEVDRRHVCSQTRLAFQTDIRDPGNQRARRESPVPHGKLRRLRGFQSLLRGERVSSVVRQLAGEEMVLFKEKINYKLAGSGERTSSSTIVNVFSY
jgi:hypothetical protein